MVASIQIIQPHWTGRGAAGYLERFWQDIDADPSCVVTVAVCDGTTWEMQGIFSTKDGALRWASAQAAPCVLIPKRIDCPEWGSATVQ